MTAHQGVRVSSSTAGSPVPGIEELSGNYRWRKTPGWTGGNVPEVLEPDSKNSGPPPGSPKSSQARAERMAVFAAARARGLGIAAAGREAGVTPATAKTYKRMLEQQGGSDA